MRSINHLQKFLEEEYKYFNTMYYLHPGFRSLHEIERGLRAVLQVFRDRLTTDDAFDVLSQLPAFMKLYFVEGWKYRQQPLRIRTLEDYVHAVDERLVMQGESRQGINMPTEDLICNILNTLPRYINHSEIKEILATLPPTLDEVILEAS